MRNDLFAMYWAQQQTPKMPPDNEVWYWAPEQVTLYSSTGVVSHTFSNGKGVVKFTAPVTELKRVLSGTPVTRITLPAITTSIGQDALFDTPTLERIDMPETVTSIGRYAFYNCIALEMEELPSSLTTFPAVGAFTLCKKVSFSYIPEAVTVIPDSTFAGCASIRITALPAGVISIGSTAFQSSSISLAELPTNLSSIGRNCFLYCKGVTLSRLPSTLTALPLGAFMNTNVSIDRFESTMDSIGQYTFYGCKGLTDITFLGTPTSIHAQAFSDCSNLTTIRVPWSSTDVINANAPWGATNATIHYNYTPTA